MRGAWWKIARLELTLAFRDRESLMWSLIAPIAMAWIFGSMFDSKPPEPTRVAVEAGANPAFVTRAVADFLTAGGMEIADDGIRVVLPDSLLDRLADGRKVDVRVVQGDASDFDARAVGARMRQAVYQLAFRAPAMLRAQGDSAGIDMSSNGPLVLTTATLGSAPRVVTGKERQLPAMLIMFIMFQVMTFFLTLWIEDLRTGKIKRIVMSPTQPRDLLAGQLVARLVWATLQIVVILGVGSLVMGVRLHVPWVSFGAVLAAFMLTAASLGMLLGSCFKTSEKANAVGVIASLVMAALGGCWWPLEIVPAAMRAVARVLPTGQAMDAIGNMMAIGPDAPFPFVNVAILVVMTAVILPIAVRRLKAQLVG
jgi:ABC-type Na+ efflux pump permease subunit